MIKIQRGKEMQMDPVYVIILITAPTEEVGKQIASSLVERKLAACANILPGMKSIFRWEGEINTEEEVLLVVKSRSELFESQLIPAVQKLHPFDVPEIIALPIWKGVKSYLDWIDEETSPTPD
jgi:periplasmic divalent cation tolerance protein